MRKFKYKKSANEEVLKPILKVVTNLRAEDKIYQGKAKSGLISYLLNEEKEGKVQLLKNGNINNEDSLKHIIISPCSIEIWQMMNEDEKLNLRTSYLEKLQVDFKKYNYLLAIEEKARKNQKGEDVMMEHYHLVTSSKVESGKSFKNYYKRNLMKNYVERFTNKGTRSKLNIKTAVEIQESKSLKMKQYHENKLKTQLDKGELSLLYGAMKSIFRDKNIDFNINRRQKYEILKNKQHLFEDLGNIKKIVSSSIKFIKNIDETIQYLGQEKYSFIKAFHKDLSLYRENYFNELKSYSLFAKEEHLFFVQVQRRKAKDGKISQAELITSVARSKSYWKEEEKYKRRQVENSILNKQEELTKSILLFESRITVLLNSKCNQQFIQEFLTQKIKFKKSNVLNINEDMQSLDNTFKLKLNNYNKYLDFIEYKISNKKQNMNYSYTKNLQNNPQV